MIKVVQKNVVFIALQLLIINCSLLSSAPAASASTANSKQSAPQPRSADANQNDPIRLACARATAPLNAAAGRIEAQQLEQNVLLLDAQAHHLAQGVLLTGVQQQVNHLHSHAVRTELTQRAHTEELDCIHEHVARTESNQQCIIGTQALILGTVMASLLFTAVIRAEISSTPAPVCLSFSADAKAPMVCYQPNAGKTAIINVAEAAKMQKLFTQVAKESKKQSFAKTVKALKKQCANTRAQLKRANRTQTCYNPRVSQLNNKKK